MKKPDTRPITRTEVEIRTFKGKQKKSRERVTFYLDHSAGDYLGVTQTAAQPLVLHSALNPYPIYVRTSDPDTIVITLKLGPKVRKLTREELRQQKRDEKARTKREEEEEEEEPTYEYSEENV